MWWLPDPLWVVLTILTMLMPVALIAGPITRQPWPLLVLPLSVCGVLASLRSVAWARTHSFPIQLRCDNAGVQVWENGESTFWAWPGLTEFQLPIGSGNRLRRFRLAAGDRELCRVTRMEAPGTRASIWPAPPLLIEQLTRHGLHPDGATAALVRFTRRPRRTTR